MISRSRVTLKSSVGIFQALETSAVSLTSAASATSLVSTASTALFPQITSWFWWFYCQWHQNDQYQSYFVEWIFKNPNFHWYMVNFMLDAVEANLCYFFEKWLMKLKFPNLRNMQVPSKKSNLQISIRQSHFKRNISIWNTLYLDNLFISLFCNFGTKNLWINRG